MAFARNEGKLKKQQPNFFKVAIRFRLNHPWPKALIYSLSTLMDRVVLNKTGPLFGISVNKNIPFSFLN